MGEVRTGADNDIDLHHGRDDKHDGMQVDTAMAVAARAFGAPLSLKIPFWKAAAIEAEAGRVQNLDADKTMIGNGGPIGQKSREQLKADKDEESNDQLRQFVAFVAEEERVREEWMRTKSSIGGVEMTGREWAEFADRLRNDDKLRRKIIDAYEAQGLSEAEANRRYDRVTDVADAMKVPPSQRTEEQTALIEKAKGDPSFSTDVKTASKILSDDARPTTAAPAPVEQKVTMVDGPGF